MKIVFISDSHGLHSEIPVVKSNGRAKKSIVNLPKDADMIIHGGDITSLGYESEVRDFLKWYSSLPYKYKIFIAGNHDFLFELEVLKAKKLLEEFPDIIYLENESIEIEGLKIYGSPVQPWFGGWAFNRHRGSDIAECWSHIPLDTDILVTHGPPAGILDYTLQGEQVGCKDLMLKLMEIRPKICIFGHIHPAAGYLLLDKTHYINGCVLNEGYELVNKPIVLEIDENKNVKRIMETNTKSEITFEDYSKLDIRICEITSVNKIDSDKKGKAYKVEINTGTEQRVVVCAIAQQFTPEQLLNKKFPFILNLPPRETYGIKSEGMIILSEGKENKLFAVGDENAEIGAVVI